MRDREELEQLFAECKALHEESNKMYQWVLITGPIAMVLCGVSGVIQAFDGHPLAAFLEFFLCLWVGVSLRRATKRHEEYLADWVEFELNHRIVMNILDVMEKENNHDEGNDERTQGPV